MTIRSTRTFSSLTGATLLFCLLGACADSDSGDGRDAADAATAMNGDASATAGSGGKAAGSGGKAAGSGGMTAGSGGGMTAGSGGGMTAGSGGRSGDGGSSTDDGMPVELGTASGFAVLAKTGISTVPESTITGDIGVSPAAATYITGFSLIADATNVFATSSQVTGRVYAADYEPPTPSDMTTAISDMETAFSDAASRAPDFTELGAGNVGGMTLEPGTYKWSTSLLVPTDLALAGDADAVWILQIAGDLTLSSGTRVTLEDGARAKNIAWQVSGETILGTTAHLEGVVLSQTAITLGTGASVNGRLLAQTSVDIDSSTVVEPAQ